MAVKQYLLLLSLNKSNAAVGALLMARIKSSVDANAAPLWIDSNGVGIFMESELSAYQVMQKAKPDLSADQRMDLRDLLIVQVGPDYFGERGAKSAAWLNSRFPKR